jgi:hypothetical protein
MRTQRLHAAVPAALIAVCVTVAIGQYALDASLSSAGRVNAHRANLKMNREIYSINRATGTMVYNRANAFNDSTYSIHQRYTQDRLENFTPAGVSTAASVRRTPPPATSWQSSVGRPATPRQPAAQPQAFASHSTSTVRSGGTGTTRVAVSSWSAPSPSYVSGVSYAGVTPRSPAADNPGAALASPGYTVPVSQVDIPSTEVVRPAGYSVARDDNWAWRKTERASD